MMALRPCYRPDVSLNDMLAAKQGEQQVEENLAAMEAAYQRAAQLLGKQEAERIDAILNR